MIDFKAYLYEKIKPTIAGWQEAGIYAISFFVYSNELNTYQGYKNVSEFAISYNTEKDCGKAPKYSEKRWNYAFWRQNTTYIIDPNEQDNEGLKTLFRWYKEIGLENIGFEDSDNLYDKKGFYIGKGPVGYYELLMTVADVARQMQTQGLIAEKFGPIPIIVHALEYCWYVEEATSHANPNGEAAIFLEALKMGFE